MSRLRLTYSNVVSTICLFVLLGGTSYAATQITSANVKNNTLTTKDVKNGSLLARDFKKGQLPRGPAGPAGPAGATGAAGATGEPGAPGPRGADAEAAPTPPVTRTKAPLETRVTIDGIGSFDATSFSLGGNLVDGGGSSKAVQGPVHITKRHDGTSAELLERVTTGQHAAQAKVELRAPGAGAPAATYVIQDVRVSKIDDSAKGDDRREDVELTSITGPKLTFDPNAPALPQDEQQIGEFTIDGLAGAIPIYRSNWGFFIPAGQLKAAPTDFQLDKAVDAASLPLLTRFLSAAHAKSATVTLFEPGTTRVASTQKLSDVVLTSYSASASSTALESLSLRYARVEQTVFAADGTTTRSCWDVLLSASC